MMFKLALASIILGTSTLAAAAPGEYAGNLVDDCESDGAPAEYGGAEVYDAPNIQPMPAPSPIQTGYPDQASMQYPPAGYGQYPVQYQPTYASPPRWRGERWQRPVVLASDVQLERRGRRFITVSPQAGRFARLELKAHPAVKAARALENERRRRGRDDAGEQAGQGRHQSGSGHFWTPQS